MNRKTMKLISILLLAIMCVFCFTTASFAANNKDTKKDDKSANADIQANQITGQGSTVNVDKVRDIGNGIAKVIRNVGVVAAVIILMYLGIKYMIGSAEEKAEYKKVFIPYLVGAVLLFSAAGIAQAIITFSGNIA